MEVFFKRLVKCTKIEIVEYSWSSLLGRVS